MSGRRKRIIVLARLETRFIKTGRLLPNRIPGGPPIPVMEEALVPHSLYWSRQERKDDLKNAKTYAKLEGYEVIVYPRGTRKPLDKAKARIVKLHGG